MKKKIQIKKKIQLKLKSLDNKSLNLYKIFLQNIFIKLKIKASFTNLPIKKKKITVLKSPHVNKKAQEHFKLQIYKKSIQIFDVKHLKFLNNILINKPKHIVFQIKIIRE